GAESGISRELVQPFQIVGGNPDNGGIGAGEFVGAFGKGMGFQITAAGIGGGIEVHHRRALLERGVQIEGGVLARQAGGSGDIRRGVAHFQGGKSRKGKSGGQGKAKNDDLHIGSSGKYLGGGTLPQVRKNPKRGPEKPGIPSLLPVPRKSRPRS